MKWIKENVAFRFVVIVGVVLIWTVWNNLLWKSELCAALRYHFEDTYVGEVLNRKSLIECVMYL